MKSRSRSLADKSVDAMLAAMELYNKPNFAYREECFSILAINAWELLLKARLLQLSDNRIATILTYERRRNADGQMSQKWYRKRNRSGTHLSIGLFGAFDRIRDEFGDKIPASMRSNLELLCEVRDSSVHFMNKGIDLAKIVQEVGTACLRNYLKLVREWFGVDLSVYNFFLMPLAFVGGDGQVEVLSLNASEQRVIEYMRGVIARDSPNEEDEYAVALTMELKFSRSKSPDATAIIVTNECVP